MTLSVLVVDDEPLARAGIRAILEADPAIDVVAEAADGAQAVAAARAHPADVVLMDIRMPEMDGIEATRQLTGAGAGGVAGGDGVAADAPRVLILTTFELDEHVYGALRAGASGFMLKDAPPEALIAAIHTVAAGEALLAPSITRRLIGAFTSAPPPRRREPSARLEALTPREREVLELVGRGLSNAEIADRLIVSPATVKTHVSRILHKLGLRDRVGAVIAAYESGLLRPGAGSEAGG